MSNGFVAPATLLAIWMAAAFAPPLPGWKVTVKVTVLAPVGMIVPLSALTAGLLRDLDRLEPYGAENARPRFLAGGLEVVGAPRRIGQGERLIARMRAAASMPCLAEAVASLLRAREPLVEEIRQLDRQLKTITVASPACQALMSIPGVGVQNSAAFAAAVDYASRFRRSRTAGAYFGLVPRRHQPGELDWTGRITKQGARARASR